MPQEVVAQIMSWIFPYDVWQFRKLSKSFNELISSSRFAALNLNRFAPIPDYSVDFSWAPTCWDMLSFHSPVSYQSEYARKNLTHFIKLIWLREIRAEVEIPASWFPHLTNLERLEWDECSLVGPIPEEIGSLQVFSNLICH
ncbi:hypothetical protein BCR33DRAFT_714883 [Rhizoclosmatium globosum]|uniref:F-box domain-containing protein n=1 Tax=Rhizoclosmatium globosum TaxID=329046 RepID=A0A1Y2CLJ1_9FUNG|nr:hypothetical protein BCR33DRAFT_714883 [Rhizoclosmatium globosum]|eukprot:ORY47826.1 hypothetical protein BCR33DRAFT_714883 [Rhizoclosmatium globosum]